jgi:type I restriction enzyme M protein
MKKRQDNQAQLILADLNTNASEAALSHDKVYAAAFRKLYYHLYSNSRASRAERIISDLSNLLLCKIVCERNGGGSALKQFLKDEGTANELLLPILCKAFPHLIGNHDKFSLEDHVLRYGLKELEPLSFQSAPAHVLGEAFQALMGPRLRGDKGQFFTPRSLVSAIVSIIGPRPYAKIVDPACGTGGFLVETHAFHANNEKSIQLAKTGRLIGIDKDRDLCRLAEAILEIATPQRAVVLNLNSLDFASLSRLSSDISPLEADYVLTNPPFGARIKITDKAILQQYALGHKWNFSESGWKQEMGVRDAQDPQILFLELCIRLLKPGGAMGIVLPEGIFGNNSLGYIWDFVRANGEIFALLDCPRTTFQPSTDTKTNVLFFQKAYKLRNSQERSSKVWTAIALHCGHDRRGRNVKSTGEPYPDDFKIIGSEFADREKKTNYWQSVELTEPYYLVPRYYDATPLHHLAQGANRFDSELITLGEMVKKGWLQIRKGHEVGAEAYGTGDIPFIRTSDISNYEVSIDSTRAVSEEIYKQYAKQQRLCSGDILMVTDGRYRIGRTAILHSHNFACLVQSHIRILSIPPRSPIAPFELLYLLNLPMVQHQIRNLVFIQSTLGALGKRLYQIHIPLPKRTTEWRKTVSGFQSIIEERANLLMRLWEFESQDYEL